MAGADWLGRAQAQMIDALKRVGSDYRGNYLFKSQRKTIKNRQEKDDIEKGEKLEHIHEAHSNLKLIQERIDKESF